MSSRVSYEHVHRLTPAEKKLLEEFAKEPSLANIARKLNITKSAVYLRSQSIRHKLEVESMQEAVEKVAPRAGLEPAAS